MKETSGSRKDGGSLSDRRRLLRAGMLGAFGITAGAVFSALNRVARAADASAPAPKAGMTRAGRSTPGNGEHARPAVEGYQLRSGQRALGVPTSCLQCVAICGVVGYTNTERIVKIEGNPTSPNNRGLVCAKAQAGINQVYDPDRLTYPLVRVGRRGEGKWKRVSMDQALDLVVHGGEIAGRKVVGLKAIYESGKPEEFMFHYGRSRIKGAVNHFCKTAFGTKTVGNHTSICETAKWLGNELTMGKHYDVNDVENSHYVLIFGANVLECHTSHSYFAQRLIDAQAGGTRIVTFDVRLSNTAAKSDEWIPLRPGTDLAVVLAITNQILTEQPHDVPLYDEEFIRTWTNVTVDELKAHYARYTPEWAEGESGVPAATIRRIAMEYGTHKPANIVTYRGYVGHYNGAHAEWAVKALEAISGNFGVVGGSSPKISGKAADPYSATAKKHKDLARKARSLKILDGEGLHMPTHHSCQWIYEMLAAGTHGRPKLYMTYCYNGAYTTGDCERNIEVLSNEEYVPFFVAVDVAMSETTELADVILPDATYLERWTLEAPQSYAMLPFLQIRQPVTRPLGEAMDMQDIFIQLARRIGGGIAKLHPFDTAEQYVESSVRLQHEANKRSGKHFYTSSGEPIEGDPWQHIRETGVLLQGTRPTYGLHAKRLSEVDLKGTVVDPATGVVWKPGKAHLSADEVAKKGYTGSKSAYKGYVGQCLSRSADGSWDLSTASKGFKPDKFNKSGRFEIYSAHMKPATEQVWQDIAEFVRADESWVKEDLLRGLPCWVPVPEHRRKRAGELVMVSFKVNVQIHSRSQNCKWLQEIYHNNPVWIHPATARRLLGDDVKEGDLIEISQAMAKLPWATGRDATRTRSISARVHLTEGIHPEVIALSFHCGHWAYGRYASGRPVSQELSGARPDGAWIWWQEGSGPSADPTRWTDISGVHPNWIIPNSPARVSGQFRSNDTVVSVRRLAHPGSPRSTAPERARTS